MLLPPSSGDLGAPGLPGCADVPVLMDRPEQSNFRLELREAELRQLDKQIFDVSEDEAVEQELEDAARYREITYAITERQSFLTERGPSLHLRGICYTPLDYIRDTSRNYE
ncbi:hypothetical protein HPB51_019366 [Rhipicephalus microplus]|uniref:Uncharacterized protein n=1 Tax=Rhipicephalus microplus TaxID=6941 RepID=A0A9J6DBQ6_RHIMP|nr:hypothetical protein HPB51_019366 [Rhipicephalus microplus]